MSKKTYEVVVYETMKETFIIKAESMDEAKEWALDQSEFGDPDISDCNEVSDHQPKGV